MIDIHEALMGKSRLWDQFTRRKEYRSLRHDEHGRYVPDRDDLDCLTDPAVSRYLQQLGYSPEYPEGEGFALCLTHDVDDIYPPLSHMLASLPYQAGREELDWFRRSLLWRWKGRASSPYRNFMDIIDLEDAYDAKSTFFFLSTERDVRRFRYDIEELEADLGSIIDRGYSVGLHGGYYAYDSLKDLMSEKARLERSLGQRVLGYRGHYLRFEVPQTWKLLAEADFSYDSTFGYGRHAGFRNQMCHPYLPYDLDEERSIDIIEIPLNLADMALFGLEMGKAWEVMRTLIDIVEKNRGVMTVLWHNNMFSSPFRRDSLRLYRKLLDYGRRKEAWIASSDEVWRWFEHGYR
ncbi:MAG: polysaccharide deacetylase family protein [Methanotrichaceae archaeon]|nr:polysaccharide deacetylase family protein [Methanotrichaceae archaeon]